MIATSAFLFGIIVGLGIAALIITVVFHGDDGGWA